MPAPAPVIAAKQQRRDAIGMELSEREEEALIERVRMAYPGLQ